MQRFAGKVALVTGGSSGLGKATAEAFAREGARVVIAARREALGREVEASIRASGGEAMFIGCDVESEQQVRLLVEQTVQTYGRLDYAYNNAWAQPTHALITDLTTEDFEKNFSSLHGLFLCMKYEIPAMMAGGGGAIVNASSAATRTALPGTGPYTAAKAAVETITRIAAQECAGSHIRVNSICLGPFPTPMSSEANKHATPEQLNAFLAKLALRRIGRPEEAAQAVLFLCSDSASYITAVNLAVDGGYL